MREAISADLRYARPVMSAVIAAAYARPSSESYGQAARHQERAEVRVAEAELAVAPGVALDLGRRIRGVADEDLLGEEHDVDRVLERLDVELAVVAAELHKV